MRLGTPFAKLLEMAGGMRGGRKLKACIPGGSSMPVLPGDTMLATDMDYDSIAKAGSMLGSGAVIVMDDTRCMVRSLLRLSYFYFEESCGQCTEPWPRTSTVKQKSRLPSAARKRARKGRCRNPPRSPPRRCSSRRCSRCRTAGRRSSPRCAT